VYHAYADRTLNLLYRFVNDEERAKDLLQDVFLKVYEGLPSFEDRSELSTWIHRIAVNHALNHLKRERRTVWFNVLDESVGSLLDRGSIDLPAWGSGALPRPDHHLEAREQEAIVERVVHELPLKYRLPYLLYRDGEMSNGEIARQLHLSVSAVETRIHRAKKMLIERLKPLLIDTG
jgi:RNA polymerase sigma-70 factor (ECF subfamily)